MTLSDKVTALAQKLAGSIRGMAVAIDARMPKTGGDFTGPVGFTMTSGSYAQVGLGTMYVERYQPASGSTIGVRNYSVSTGKVAYLVPVTFSNGLAGALTGNADTATKLAAARKINGVSFDGGADITLPGVTRMQVQDRRASGVAGQTVSNSQAATNVTRELQTLLVNEIAGATLSANKVTLTAAGTYRVRAAIASGVAPSVARLFDAVNNAVIGVNLTINTPNAGSGVGHIAMEGTVVVAAGGTASVEIQQYLPGALLGLGSTTLASARSISGYQELYANLVIEKMP